MARRQWQSGGEIINMGGRSLILTQWVMAKLQPMTRGGMFVQATTAKLWLQRQCNAVFSTSMSYGASSIAGRQWPSNAGFYASVPFSTFTTVYGPSTLHRRYHNKARGLVTSTFPFSPVPCLSRETRRSRPPPRGPPTGASLSAPPDAMGPHPRHRLLDLASMVAGGPDAATGRYHHPPGEEHRGQPSHNQTGSLHPHHPPTSHRSRRATLPAPVPHQ